MARVTTTTERLYGELVAEGAWTGSSGQLQQAIEARLGPIPGDPDPVGHWRAVDALRGGRTGRLPDYDAAALDLAESGHPCIGLVSAVRRIAATEDPGRDPEDAAEALMALRADSDHSPYGVHLAARLRAGGRPRPESTGEEARLEALGQAQAVAAEMGEMANGASPVDAIDPDDVAQVFGMPVDLVRAYILALANAFGPGGVTENVDQLVDGADPAELALAVQAAAGLFPLYEHVVGPVGSRSNRRKWIAAACPLFLRLGDLYGAVVDALGETEAGAAIPSMFDPTSPALAQAQGTMRALKMPAPTDIFAGNEGAADVD
jgi:hypothetical protein